jgi:hypothetical protein
MHTRSPPVQPVNTPLLALDTQLAGTQTGSVTSQRSLSPTQEIQAKQLMKDWMRLHKIRTAIGFMGWLGGLALLFTI